MGILKKVLKLICVPILIFLGVLMGPNTLPETVTFTEFRVTSTKNLGEGFNENELLNNAERLFEDKIKGPEAFEIINGELYTTLHGGYIGKINEDQIIPIVKFGKDCIGWWEESKCGRPLGIKAYRKNELIVADAYLGIFKYNLKSGNIENLIDKNTVIDGKRPQIFNAVEVDKDGFIYWTHSSSDFSLEDNIFTFLADGSGRLIKYDPNTKKNVVLMKNLFFANGLVISPEEDFLLVAETGHSRIHRYYLKGPKKFTSDIFIDGLPGTPDNLRQNGIGGFFAPLVTTRDEKSPSVFQVIAPFPSLRKFVALVLSYVELTLNKIYQIYPSYFLQRAIHYVGHLESISPVLPTKTTVLEIDKNGVVLNSYHGTDGSVSLISDVIIHNGYLYLGSPVNNYLGRIKLSKLKGNQPKISNSIGWRIPPQTMSNPSTTTSNPQSLSPATTLKSSTYNTLLKPDTKPLPQSISSSKPILEHTSPLSSFSKSHEQMLTPALSTTVSPTRSSSSLYTSLPKPPSIQTPPQPQNDKQKRHTENL